MKLSEHIFVFVCKYILLMKVFKKYWPVGGSYWNTSHINPNKRDDLEEVIEQANNFTKQHLPQAFILLFLSIGMYITNAMDYKSTVGMVLLLIVEVYAFAAHHYNRVLARNKLATLPKKEAKKTVITQYDYLDIQDSKDMHLCNGEYYGVRHKTFYMFVGPYFLKEKDAIDFAKYIIEHKTEQEFLIECYKNRCKSVYDDYSRSCKN